MDLTKSEPVKLTDEQVAAIRRPWFVIGLTEEAQLRWFEGEGLDSVTESTGVSPPAYRPESISKQGVTTMEKTTMDRLSSVTFDAFGCLIAYAIVDAFFGLVIWLVWMNFGGRWGLPRVAWLDVWCGLMLYDFAVKMLVTPWRIETQKDKTDGKPN